MLLREERSPFLPHATEELRGFSMMIRLQQKQVATDTRKAKNDTTAIIRSTTEEPNSRCSES